MKKFTSVLLLAFTTCIVLASCKKDYTCTCYDNANIAKDKSVYNQTTKNTADEKCALLNKGAAVAGGYCSLN